MSYRSGAKLPFKRSLTLSEVLTAGRTFGAPDYSDPNTDPLGARMASYSRGEIEDRDTDAILHTYTRYNPEGGVPGTGMEVTLSGRENNPIGLGAIYPIHPGPVDIRYDGGVINKMRMTGTVVKFGNDRLLKNVMRYNVELYADERFAPEPVGPIGTLTVMPVAVMAPGGVDRLMLHHHEIKVKVGTKWIIKEKENITIITDADVKRTAQESPAWDRRLVETVDATMWRLHGRNGVH